MNTGRIKEIKRRLPNLFKDLMSQLRFTKIPFLLDTHVVTLPEDVKVNNDIWLYGHIKSSSGIIVYTFLILRLDHRKMNCTDWHSDRATVVNVGGDTYVLSNFPSITIRPFPDESFVMTISNRVTVIATVPYVGTKL